MILLNIFLFIIICLYESLGTSIDPYEQSLSPSFAALINKIYIINPCCGATNDVTKVLPPGYIHTPGVGVHKMHTKLVTWNVARNTCIREGGHLCIIDNPKEDRLVREVGNRVGATQVHLGMHDLYFEGDWVTILDQPLRGRYTNWCLDNPNNGCGNRDEDCGAYLVSENGWNDIKCNLLHEFMCEFRI